jgi:hypothetical protein
VPRSETTNNPKHWRARAAQMRALAACMSKTETTAIMVRLADDYDKRADRTEERADGKCYKQPKKR